MIFMNLNNLSNSNCSKFKLTNNNNNINTPKSKYTNKSNDFNNVSISLLHIRSINKKSFYILDLLSSHSPDFLALTETWHEDANSPSLISATPFNYSFLELARPPTKPLSSLHSTYGGVCLFFKSSFSASRHSFKFTSFECLVTSFKASRNSFSIVVIYRPPSSSLLPLFLDEFYSLVESLYSFSIPFYIVGDFNIHFNDKSNYYTLKFMDVLLLFNLSQHCTFPTIRTGNTIDFLISSSFCRLNNISADKVHFTDHYLIKSSFSLNSPIANSTCSFTKRCWSLLNKELFLDSLTSSNFDASLFGDVDDLVSSFNDLLIPILDKLVPLKSFTYRLSSRKAPWFDMECILYKRRVRKLEKVYRMTLSASSFSEWKSKLASYRSLLFSKHSSYLRKSIISASTSKHRWASLSKLLHKNTPPPPFSAQQYHDYISDKVNSIRLSNSDSSTPTFSPLSPENAFVFSPVSLPELTKIIDSMSSSTCSLDLVPTFLLKEFSSYFYPLILKLVNLSLTTSKFPTSFKSSNIVPMIKNLSLDPSVPSSYRPVSNLSFISKVLEKVVFLQLDYFLNRFSLLPPTQSGFRRSHSTETALLKIYNDALLASDMGNLSILLCLDYSSAFDTVDHSLLLELLDKSFHISGPSNSWFYSYLYERYSTVFIENSRSLPSSVPYGVPQGSILGPLLFILYTSELPRIINSFSLQSQLYADDSYIYMSFPKSSLTSVILNLTSCLDSIISWSSSMSLKLNPSKFELIFLNKSVKNSIPLRSINISSNFKLESSPSIRSLGFIFDSSLSLVPQINSVAKSCYFHLRRIRLLLPFLDDPTLQLLVSSLVLSRMDYCNSLYYGLPDSTLFPLTKAFNCAARLVSRTPRFSHISPSLVALHWLPLRYRIIFKICTFMFKLHNGNFPIYLTELISKPQRKGLRSSSHSHFFISQIRHSYAKSAFTYSGPFLWNSLPPHLTSSLSLAGFRKDLKTHLFYRFVAERC